MDKKVKSFIQHLLIGNPEKRMGSNFINGKNDIYSHKWFKDFNWESLLNKSMIAWHIPKVKNQGVATIEVKVFLLYSFTMNQGNKCQQNLCSAYANLADVNAVEMMVNIYK